MEAQENELDSLLELMRRSLQLTTSDESSMQYAYVHYNDIRSIEEFSGETVIIIKAPTGSLVEVLDPSETGVSLSC